MSSDFLELGVCARTFSLELCDARVSQLFHAAYGAMLRRAERGDGADFRIASTETGFLLAEKNAEPFAADDVDELLYCFDKRLTVTLQLQRPELYFLHGAVLAWGDRAVVLSAASGTGKSTAAFALTQTGAGYLSDELAPIDIATLNVHPYPHALCLKARPPEPYRLPPQTLDAGFTLHVPVDALPLSIPTSVPVAAFFFLHRAGAPASASLRRLSPAAVAAHLTSNALNALAHPRAGLEAAALIAGEIPGYEIDTTDLAEACRVIKDVVVQPQA